MEFISPELAQYCEAHTSAESDVLFTLNRNTHLKVLMPRMLSGHLQGRFLSMVSHMIKPECVLEIGTYTGYSALCMAEGLKEGGKLISIDINEEVHSFAQQHIDESQYKERIQLITGNALTIIPEMKETFDMVFIDADKQNYLNYYLSVFDKVKNGGFILADNVLWSGKVLAEKKDKDTQAICAFNDYVMQDERVEKILLPLRDGIFMIRKK